MSFNKILVASFAKVPIFGPSVAAGAEPAPERLTHPSIAANGQQGNGTILTATPGTYVNADTVAGRWQLAAAASPAVFVDISGATNLTFTLASPLEAGSVYRYRETATNSGGDATGTSNTITLSVPANSVAPAVTHGALTLGTVLTCSTGTWSGLGNVYTRQWYRDGVAINGQTASTYTTILADEDHLITCRVTATNAIGASLQAVSNTIAWDDPLRRNPSTNDVLSVAISGQLGDVYPQTLDHDETLSVALSGTYGEAYPNSVDEINTVTYGIGGSIDLASAGTPYRTAVVAAGMTSHWAFSEASGTVVDDSIGALDGAMSGTYTRNLTSFVDGGTSTYFATAGGMFRYDTGAASGSGLDPTAFSIGGWFAHSHELTSAGVLFAMVQTSDLTTRRWDIQITPSTRTLIVRGASSFQVVPLDANLVISPYTWNHIFLVVNGSDMKLYLNGVMILTSAAFTRNTTTGNLSLVMGKFSSTAFFTGRIDEMAYVASALTAAQIQTLYNASFA